MRRTYFFLLLLPFFLHAQSSPSTTLSISTTNTWNIGVELDALPYLTGGYFGALWLGKNQWRGRALIADVNLPDFVSQEGFKNHHIQAYALLADYFFQKPWKGWWIGAGPVYWSSTIQSNNSNATQSFENILFNGSLGYHIPIHKNIYLSPWAGMSAKLAGNDRFVLDQKNYHLPFLNPEISLKIGIFL